MRRRALPLLAVLAALLLAGCGVPSDGSPQPLDPAAAPAGVFDRTQEPTQQGDLLVELWFVRGDRLVPVSRAVELPGTPQRVLRTLFDGPTAQESDAGLSSRIPTTIRLVGLTLTDTVAVVELSDVEGSAQLGVLPVAQIVATLTGRPGVTGVRFRSGDTDLRVPQGDTSLTDAPVDRADYAEVLGPAPAVTTSPVPAPSPLPESSGG